MANKKEPPVFKPKVNEQEEIGKWALIGGALAIICVIAGGMYYIFNQPVYTDDQKVEINNAYAANCTKCLVEHNSNCTTVQSIQQTPWGGICENRYINRTCNQYCRVIK